MSLKTSRLYSIIKLKCPRCHEGNLFTSKAYSLKFMHMPEKCLVCNLRYEPEPAFYTGAMYVSYALQVAMFVAIYTALRILFNPPLEIYFITMIAVPAMLIPVTLRLSRAIYINFFYSYHPDWTRLADTETHQPSATKTDAHIPQNTRPGI